MKNLVLLIVFIVCISCTQKNGDVKIHVDESKQFQIMQSFGASDSWRIQFVGENWPVEKRNRIADLLFSMDIDKTGNPRGIGLSNWRFYLGAGSAEQGEASDIQNVWRRSECFLDKHGQYDWSKYKGQRWFLKAAKSRGVGEFTAYTISPPVFYTKNGLAHASKGDLSFNLKDEYYDDYARYLVDVLDYFDKNEQVHFNYISPFNEPQWAWDKNNQEGTPATNEELYNYMRLLSEELYSRGLSTKILPGEAGQLDYLFEKKGDNNNGDQINAFWNPSSPFYVGGFKNMEYAITSHSYFTTWPIKTQVETRERLAQRINEIDPKLRYMQTEFCILEKNPEITGGWRRDLDMPTALYVARVIHSDLTIANACSWEWWTALSQFDFKDGLIHLDDGIGNGVKSDTSQLNHDLMYDGQIQETKLLWALGNFSRFVRPGMVRIDAQIESDLSLEQQATDMQVSAYKDLASGDITLVLINHTEQEKAISLDGFKAKTIDMYVTDNAHSLNKVDVKNNELVVSERSVSTLVLKR
ncbi:glycoside hydrolase [Carboxylicivirga sp. M1479]|uniref:glycoside hydrolase n=1 Tax=Carboxylicivirga sp. M1479 TaxID=2594476 RepID=UPI0011780CB3|nr:glycoside hydrolase [Carboxylicivirga sp. M1479]TRX71167.1 endo-1,4-beta-xylanase [Carboxylicivirga sp. M1479]